MNVIKTRGEEGAGLRRMPLSVCVSQLPAVCWLNAGG